MGSLPIRHKKRGAVETAPLKTPADVSLYMLCCGIL
nr:MAG TPA: hypothetical protein [Bacteriophage sp.]